MKAPPSCEVSGCVGEGVDTSSGAFRTEVEDVIVPPGLFAVELVRTYASDNSNVGWFGRGWSTVYETRLVVDEDLITLEAPSGLAPLWMPEVPSGWFAAGDPGLSQAGDRYLLTWPSGETWTFAEGGALVSLLSPYGAAVTISRTGQTVTISSSQGVSLTLELGDGRVVAAETSDGREVVYRYVDDHLTEVRAPGANFRYRYDNEGAMIESSAPAGVTTIKYEEGRVSSQRAASGESFDLSYAGRTTTVSTARLESAYVHDAGGRLVRITRGGADVVVQRYEADRLVERREYALPSGDLVSAVRRTYTDGVLSSATVNGITSTFAYDAEGRMAELTGPTAASFEYSANGPLPVAVTTPDHGRSELRLEEGFIVRVVDATGAAVLTNRDALGNPVATGRFADSMWTYEFDAEGNVTRATAPSGRTWLTRWGPRSALLEERDPLGRRTTYEYDAAGRITSEMLPGPQTTERRYDRAGRLVEIIEPGDMVTRYEYGTHGRVVTIIGPDERAWRLSYADAADGSYTVTVTAPDGVSTETVFDSANRETRRRSLEADGSVVEVVESIYEFDRLVKVVTSRGPSQLTRTTAYDDRGRVIRVETSLDGSTTEVSTYGYLDGRLASVSSDAGAASYSYDAAGRLVEVIVGDDSWRATYQDGALTAVEHDGVVTRVEHDMDGRTTALVTPDGITTSWRYDDADRPVSRTVGGAEARFIWTEGDQLSEYHAPTGAAWTWGYDAAGRLASAAEPGGVVTTYEYGAAAVTRIRSSGAERDRDDRFTYDARGLLQTAETGAGDFEYVYDATDRIVAIDGDRDGDDEHWTLDAAGFVTGVEVGDDAYSLDYTADGQLDLLQGPDEDLLDVSWIDGHLESMQVDDRDPMGLEVDDRGRIVSVVWDDDTGVGLTWHDDGSFDITEFGAEEAAASYRLNGRRLMAFVAHGRAFEVSSQDNGYLATLAMESAEVSGVVKFDQLGRPATLHTAGRTASITYSGDGRVSSVVVTQAGEAPRRSTVSYDDEGRHIDGDDDLVTALFDETGALRQSLPNSLPNPLSASSDGVELYGSLAVDGAEALLSVEPDPFEQVEDAVVQSTPRVTSPIGVRDRVRLARQLLVAEVDRIGPVVEVEGTRLVHVPVVDPDDGGPADFNPFTDALQSGLAIGALAREAGGGGSLLDRAIDRAGDIAGGLVSIGVDVAHFVVTNPIARLLLSAASVVAASVACAPTSGLACVPFAVVAVGLLAGDASLTIANAVPAILADCPSGGIASCGLRVAHLAVAGTQLFLAGRVAASLIRVAGRAVAEAAAEGAAVALASGESGVARTELLVALRGGRVAAREVPACVDGVCARFDLVVRRFNGRLIPVEVKNGPGARFTPNQTRVYPMLDETAAYLPSGLLNGGAPQVLAVGRPVVHHWNSSTPLRLP